MPDPRRGAPPEQENKEPKPEWTRAGKARYREWVERRWPNHAIDAIAEKGLKLTEQGPSILRETGTWWQKGAVEINFFAEQWEKKGKARTEGEDRVFCLPDRGLFIVNDGIGGHDAGEYAAALTGVTTAAFFPKERAPDDGAHAGIKRAMVASQNILERFGEIHREETPGTCVGIAYIHPEQQGKGERIRATVGGVGDVEIYRLRPDGTVDVVYRGSRQKKLRHMPQEHARSAPGANYVSHSIGARTLKNTKEVKERYKDQWQEKEIELFDEIAEESLVLQDIVLEPGEILLVATDGLHDNMIIRRTDGDWRKDMSHKPNTLESIVESCKTPDGQLDIEKLNAKLLLETQPDKQRKADDRGWAIIAPKIKTT